MTMNEHELHIVLTRLIAGESAEHLVKEFPGLQSEILSHAKVMDTLARTKESAPQEAGLYQALTAMRAPHTAPTSTPSPFAFVRFTNYSFIYRGALVLPLVLIVLLASGAYFIPRKEATPDMPATPFADSSASSAEVSMSAPVIEGGGAMKTMALIAPAPEPLLPQDTTLAAIFGPEISHDVQAVQEDSTQAVSASDDTDGTEGYTNTYDEHEF